MEQGAMGWLGAKAELAGHRSRLNVDPDDPHVHVYSLINWAHMNLDFVSQEPHAYDYRDLIVDRLRRLGAEPIARQFEELDPVDEIWVRRYWVPPEGHAWKDSR